MGLIASRIGGVPTQRIESPLFLIGSERSGTTLLRLMLDHHPGIAFNLESEFLVSEVSAAGAFPDVADYRRGLRENRVFRHSRFDIRDDLDYPGLVNDFLRQKLERDRKGIVGATVHYGFSKLRYLWPRARYVYMLRDGRDVASSIVEMGWAGNVFVGAQWWLEAEHEWAEYRGTLTRDRWIEVRYEELIANPEAQLRRICELAGVAFSDRMFDYVRTSSYSLPDPAHSCKWRRKIPSADLRVLEARIGPQLAGRGYELGCKASPRISRAHARWLQWQSRLKVLLRKIEMIGFGLFIREVAGRRLGWKTLHAKALHAIDSIIDGTLK